MKVALAHDWITNMGGAEIFLLHMTDIFKKAPIYTTLYNKTNVDERFHSKKIFTSFIQKIKNAEKHHQKYLPLMPTAWEQFSFNSYDAVISSSSCCAKGIVTSPDTMHICYCHSPMRYAWEFYWEYIEKESYGRLKKILVPFVMNYIRQWDYTSASRVDFYIANSQNVARRIKKHYRRNADVIYSPVQNKFFTDFMGDEDFYLIVSRLVPYKKVDLAVEAFNELGLPLVVIGTGPQLDYLQSIAKSNIKFLGRQPDEVVIEHYAKCRAFIFPGEEDFGLTPVEVQASGRPVIAFGKGGALETVVNEKTGLFFNEQTLPSLKQAVSQFQGMEFSRSEIIDHASRFNEDAFKAKMREYVFSKHKEYVNMMSSAGRIIKQSLKF